MTSPLFPGGVAVSLLDVYDGEAADGRCGGTPHLHTASSEGYVVLSGSGAVQTIDATGFAENPLATGDVVWFSPGTVHRLVNDDDLRLAVVMQNSGLPEAGDAVMTFPAHVLDDPDAYARAAALPAGRDRADAVRVRRDLAIDGYEQLLAGGPAALDALHRRAAALVGPRIERWRALWEQTVAAETARTRGQLDALGRGEPGLMAAASVQRAESSPGGRAYGMCGRLTTWTWPDPEEPA